MSVVDAGIEITVFDKGFVRKGWVTDPLYVTLTPRHNALGTGEIELRTTDPMLPTVLAKGARFRVMFRGAHLMSGRFRTPRGPVYGAHGGVVIQLASYYRWMETTLGWVIPREMPYSSGALAPLELADDAQTFNSEMNTPGTATGLDFYQWPDGSGAFGGMWVTDSESAVKDIVGVNMRNRLGRPITITTQWGRGGDARGEGKLPQVRFAPLDEALAELLEWSDLGVLFEHVDGESTVRMDVRETAVWPEITTESGAAAGGDWEINEPTATRVVVGGPGESTARAFWGMTDLTGLEDEWGDIVEVFRDATSIRPVWPSTLAENLQVPAYYRLRPEVPELDKIKFVQALVEAGAKALTEGRPSTGISLEVAETPEFHFGGPEGIQLGDRLPFRIGTELFTERVSAATISFDPNDGLNVTPLVGKKEDTTEAQLAAAINTIAGAVQRIASDR